MEKLLVVQMSAFWFGAVSVTTCLCVCVRLQPDIFCSEGHVLAPALVPVPAQNVVGVQGFHGDVGRWGQRWCC